MGLSLYVKSKEIQDRNAQDLAVGDAEDLCLESHCQSE